MQIPKDEDEGGVHDYYDDEDPRAPVQQTNRNATP